MMDGLIPAKAFFRIGEVSRILNVKPYVIRYWESEFASIKPHRTTAGHRVYTRPEVEELLLIRHLLYDERFTIKGAKEELKRRQRQPADDAPEQLLRCVKKGLCEIKSLLED